ncbi:MULTISPECIES: hypothetical protein [Parafrankia]|uniref:Uncharacterized protein n=1 Tax=Parafrankia soli TaxID=2599596 RepID=A0A1S1QZN8_9ACTN|nr:MULTISPECIES: hypothetical protein [Parafrankia]OHV40158.1 hypothetical protein BBK14_13255 [Parafrankia soli]CAI7978650.1 conserved hypothetical protein [Frankia sp. Hr75.2]SQD94220.1 conserved hypothetical protein [Parafrankia sp. Ea1.12]
MRMTPLTPACGAGSCPRLYLTEAGTIAVQGPGVSADEAEVELAPGEHLVEIPRELLIAAVRSLGA